MMLPKLESLLRRLDLLFAGLACLALIAIIGVVLLQIVARFALPRAPVWTEELSRYLFVYAIILASGSVIVRGRHVRLELYQHRIKRRTAAFVAMASHIGVAVFAAVLLPPAWNYAQLGSHQTSPALGIRMSWIFGSTVVFFALVLLFSLLAALQQWLSIRSRGQR